MSGLLEGINIVKSQIKAENIDPHLGLGPDLFLFISTLVPIINIDLFITNDKGQFLATWREDQWYGAGWHLPGGCVRFKETFTERAHRTAMDELGVDVVVNPVHLLLTEHIDDGILEANTDTAVREHFVSILFGCRLLDPDGLRNVDSLPIKGHMGWFNKTPDKFLPAQSFYRDYIESWLKTYG